MNTKLIWTQDLREASDHKALKKTVEAYTARFYSFYPSILRYKVKHTPKNTKKYRAENGILSKILPVNSNKIWYDDDDYLADRFKRLGVGIQKADIDKEEHKLDLQNYLQNWCYFYKIKKYVQEAIDILCPGEYKQQMQNYGVKFDLYTNRTLPTWHQDWDDGHGLFVGLLNLSTSNGNPGSIKATEILNYSQKFQEWLGDPNNQEAKVKELLNSASQLRKNLMEYSRYAELDALEEEQPFGQIRWFNDAVLVHRTPPYAIATQPSDYNLVELNKKFGVANWGFPQTVNLPAKMTDASNYLLNQQQPVNRALLRITVREWRQSENKRGRGQAVPAPPTPSTSS